MLNISEKRNINFENFLHYARNIGIYVNKYLCIKEVSKGNNGIFSNNDIHKNELLIELPKSFLIPKSIFTNYILEQEIEYQVILLESFLFATYLYYVLYLFFFS